MATLARAGTPPLPIIPAGSFNITSYGAVGDGVTDNTRAIQATINAANMAGGGTVEIPANGTSSTYWCGPLTLASSINLQIDSGATLQMLPMSRWPTGTPPFINGSNLHDVEISGLGTIDGQGQAWWTAYESSGVSRPTFINISGCTRVLIQSVTLQNPPTFHLVVKGENVGLTIQNITINTSSPSPNTDGIDLASTNVLIQGCSISDGDDNIALGSGSGVTSDITITNCTFGAGHGLSIGSSLGGKGVNNLMVSNCTWNGTEYGIHMKSDRGRGALVQNLQYLDLTMNNVNFPIAIYSYYNELKTPVSSINVSPYMASTDLVQTVNNDTPIWQNITISNLTATGIGGNIAGIIWGLPEALVSNVTLDDVNISGRTMGNGTFCMYNVQGIQLIDSNLTAPTTGTNTLTLYNAQVTITNSAANANVVTIGGVGSPSSSGLSLFNAQASMSDASVLGANPLLTLAGSILTVNNDMNAGSLSSLNFGLGTTVTKAVVTGNLTLSGIPELSVFDGGGFTAGTYTLFTYNGFLVSNGNRFLLGRTPNPNFAYAVDTTAPGVVKLDVTCAAAAAGPISGPNWVRPIAGGVVYSISSVSGATTYTWTVPPGATIASGQGTTSIMVNYGSFGWQQHGPHFASSGNVTVTPSNGSCSGTPSSLAVTVRPWWWPPWWPWRPRLGTGGG
jgi:polygalacturonase